MNRTDNQGTTRRTVIKSGLLVGVGLAFGRVPSMDGEALNGAQEMKVHYLEIVTRDVDAVCAAYASMYNVQFGEPDAGLGNARTARLAGGGLVGVRAPLREDEEPVVRPYWLVHDIHAAVDEAVQAGGQVAHPPMEISGHGTFAIYHQGGNDHGIWQL